MEKEIIWANQAKDDLRQIYHFNSLIQDEEKAFKLIESIIKKTERLTHDISGGTPYISKINPKIRYHKLVFKHISSFSEHKAIQFIFLKYLTLDKIQRS